MPAPREYDFNKQLQLSQGAALGESVTQILLQNLPSVVAVHQAHEDNDRNGTDYWGEMSNGKMLSVDCKIRSKDWLLKGDDDLALETWSVVEKKVVGWTRDTKKQTDYILWYWEPTTRWCLVPFPMLCQVFENNWQIWGKEYKTSQQKTPGGGGYHSECTFVPRREVWAAIYNIFGSNGLNCRDTNIGKNENNETA